MPPLTTTERAYELARSGSVRTITELLRKLSSEGCENVYGDLYGETIRKPLRRLMKAARRAMAE